MTSQDSVYEYKSSRQAWGKSYIVPLEAIQIILETHEVSWIDIHFEGDSDVYSWRKKSCSDGVQWNGTKNLEYETPGSCAANIIKWIENNGGLAKHGFMCTRCAELGMIEIQYDEHGNVLDKNAPCVWHPNYAKLACIAVKTVNGWERFYARDTIDLNLLTLDK